MSRRCARFLWLLLFFGMTGLSRAQEAPSPTVATAEGETVKARGVVTFVQDARFYIQSKDAAWQVLMLGSLQKVSPGDQVEVEGKRNGPTALFRLTGTSVAKQSSGPVPTSEDLTIEAMCGGAALNRLVRVKGSVHDVVTANGRVQLFVDDSISSAHVIITDRPEAPLPKEPFTLMDAVIEITGIATSGVRMDSGRAWALMPVRSFADIRIIEPGRTDAFQIPLQTLEQVRRAPASESGKRKRVIAKVTYASGSGWFYIQDEAGFTARARKPDLLPPSTAQHREVQADTRLQIGDVIELVGQVPPTRVADNIMPWFVQCEWRTLRHEGPPEYANVDPNDLFDPKYDGKPVSVAGWVAGVNVSDDPNGYVNHYLDLGGISALVQLRERVPLPFKIGDAVRVKGAVKANYSASGNVTAVRINAQGFDDVRVIPFAMNRDTFIRGSLIALGCLAGAVLWIIMLRRRVRQQTAKIIAANDELSRFKQVADSSTDFIAMATLENRPLYMNAAGRSMLGIDQGADLGQIQFTDICPPTSLELMNSIGFPHAFQHGHWQAELNMRKVSGEEIPVSFLGLVLKGPDGQPQYISSIARDISDRHKLEHQLRDSNKDLLRFKAIADTMRDLVAMADLSKKTLYMNAAGRALLGIGMDEPAESLRFESIYTNEALSHFEREGFAHAFQHGHWSAEITMRHRDGTIIPVEFSGLVLYNDDGSPLCLSCIARDLRQRLALERQLRDALDHERELNQLKSGFVNTISHEFRTPLGIILFASSMMRRFNETFSADERAAQLDAIDEAVERMNELVEQSLSLGRAEAAAPKKTTFDLMKFSTRVIDEVMSATSHRSPISLVSVDPLPAAHTDEIMLRTILANLLGNAVKYSPAGSPISLRVEKMDDAKVVFVVRDHGPGLSEEDLPKLFTTFHRGKGVEGIPGSGLGLAIVKRCTEALGGTVAARNAADGGAEFVVELPLFISPS